MDECLGNTGYNAYAECPAARADVIAHDITELAAEPEHVFRVAHGFPTEWRQNEWLAATIEQLGVEVFLERTKLGSASNA